MVAPISQSVGQKTLGELITETQRTLEQVGIDSAGQEALWIVEHALRLPAHQIVANRDRSLSFAELQAASMLIGRRVAREPLQYILGTQEFCGMEFEVNPAVLIPRPETELLVQEAIRRLPQGGRTTVVDVGTGSGCLAVTVARALPNARVLATDLSVDALETAKRNARRHGVETAICWLEGDLLAALAGLGCERAVTAILANPPYIRESDWSGLQQEVSGYEPRMALVAGTKGTEVHERLLVEA